MKRKERRVSLLCSAVMEPFIPSLFFYAIVVGFCEVCRRGCDKYLKNSGSPISPKGFLISAIGALQAITCVYENQLVVQHYGLAGFAITVFLLLNVHRLTNRGCILSPAAVSERYLTGQIGLLDSVGVVVAELLGGTFGFQLAGLFWRLGLSEQHFVHYKTFDCVLAYKVLSLINSITQLWKLKSFLLDSHFDGCPVRICGSSGYSCYNWILHEVQAEDLCVCDIVIS